MNVTRIVRHVNLPLAVLIIAACSLFAGRETAAAQYTGRTLVFGPLMVALDLAYAQWVAGPLEGVVPDPSTFEVRLDASGDPYTVTFSAQAGSTVAGGSYPVASTTVIDGKWPPVPSTYLPDYPRGPLTISGAYARAFMSAYRAHHSYEEPYGDAFAFLDSPGGGVVIVGLTHDSTKLLVGINQKYKYPGPGYVIGCYKEQFYFVDLRTFEAVKTRAGCPG
jgi:hypothetical protein